jgi:hypothetical protein
MAEAIDFSTLRKSNRGKKKKAKEEAKAEGVPVDANYLQMLDRIYDLLAAKKGSNASAGEGPTAIAPRVVRHGAKKTAFINF